MNDTLTGKPQRCLKSDQWGFYGWDCPCGDKLHFSNEDVDGVSIERYSDSRHTWKQTIVVSLRDPRAAATVRYEWTRIPRD